MDRASERYKCLAIPLVVCLGLYVVAFAASDYTMRHVNRVGFEHYLKGERAYTPWDDGLPWELNTLYRDIPSLPDNQRIVVMGPSTSREAFVEDRLTIPSGWHFRNVSMGGESIDTFEILWNYMDRYAPRPLGRSDALIIQVSFLDFVDRPLREDQLKSELEMFGFYRVNEQLDVEGHVPPLVKAWTLFNYKIRFAISYVLKSPKILFGPNLDSLTRLLKEYMERWEPQAPSAARREDGLPNSALREDYRAYWVDYMRQTRIPGRTTESFERLLRRIHSQTNVAVVNLYVPSWVSDYPHEKLYRAWIQNELKDFLRENAIPFIDMERTVADENFADSVHLLYPGRVEYTEAFNAAMSPVWASLGITSTERDRQR